MSRCAVAWSPTLDANLKVRCLREAGHSGRCFARHPVEHGEFVYPSEPLEPEDLDLPTMIGEPEPLI